MINTIIAPGTGVHEADLQCLNNIYLLPRYSTKRPTKKYNLRVRTQQGSVFGGNQGK